MLEFAGLADDGALAVTLHPGDISAERCQEALRHVEAERPQHFHPPAISNVGSRKGIPRHGKHGTAAPWLRQRRPALMVGLFNLNQDLPDFDPAHSVSCTATMSRLSIVHLTLALRVSRPASVS
jgi:hypothetical protein